MMSGPVCSALLPSSKNGNALNSAGEIHGTTTHEQMYSGVQELKVLRRAGVRTFAEADAYEVEHRRRRALASLRLQTVLSHHWIVLTGTCD